MKTDSEMLSKLLKKDKKHFTWENFYSGYIWVFNVEILMLLKTLFNFLKFNNTKVESFFYFWKLHEKGFIE